MAMQTALEEQLKGVPRGDAGQLADDYVSTWVQRVKSFKATFDGDSLVIDFKTKDDHGWYVYQFAVML